MAQEALPTQEIGYGILLALKAADPPPVRKQREARCKLLSPLYNFNLGRQPMAPRHGQLKEPGCTLDLWTVMKEFVKTDKTGSEGQVVAMFAADGLLVPKQQIRGERFMG
jgi:hypothetical protein